MKKFYCHHDISKTNFKTYFLVFENDKVVKIPIDNVVDYDYFYEKLLRLHYKFSGTNTIYV